MNDGGEDGEDDGVWGCGEKVGDGDDGVGGGARWGSVGGGG